MKKVIISYMPDAKKLATDVSDFIMRFGIHPMLVHREQLGPISGFDLAISIGGDGTFLNMARHITDKTPIVGINLDVRRKEGFYLSLNKSDFKKGLTKIFKGKYKVQKLLRLQALIGKDRLPLALNEYYVGSSVPYDMSEYWLAVKGKKEYQRSSGILVSTPTGSNAWSRAAGGKPHIDNSYQLVVREPYRGRLTKQSVHWTVLFQRQKVSIKSDMDLGIIAADSQEPPYSFKKGEKVTISISKHPIFKIVL